VKFRNTSKNLNFNICILKTSAFKRAPYRSVAEWGDINVEFSHNNNKVTHKVKLIKWEE